MVVRVWIFVGIGVAVASLVHASPVTAQISHPQASISGGAQQMCEVHVWQSKFYASATPAPYGALLQSLHDSKYPADTVRGQMAYEFRTEALAGLVGSAPWESYFGQPVKIVVEPEGVEGARWKAMKANPARNSNSAAPCYLELFIGRQSFEGGFIKAHLFSSFTLRNFRTSAKPSEAIVWSQTKGFPAKEEASIPAASQTIRNAFVNNVSKLLSKKLAKR